MPLGKIKRQELLHRAYCRSHYHLPRNTHRSSLPSSVSEFTLSLSPLPILFFYPGFCHVSNSSAISRRLLIRKDPFNLRALVAQIPFLVYTCLCKSKVQELRSVYCLQDTFYCSADTRRLPKTGRKGVLPHISQQNKPDRPVTWEQTLLGLQGNKKYNSHCSHFIQHQTRGTILST